MGVSEKEFTEVPEYDELSVRWMIKKAPFYDERFEVESKSGTNVDVER